MTKLVFLFERWYDPELGRWLDAGLDSLFERMESITKNPRSINGYQYQRPINVHLLDEDSVYMTCKYQHRCESREFIRKVKIAPSPS